MKLAYLFSLKNIQYFLKSGIKYIAKKKHFWRRKKKIPLQKSDTSIHFNQSGIKFKFYCTFLNVYGRTF